MEGIGTGIGALIYLFVAVVVLVVIFLLLREFWCWYWKINVAIDLLQKIDKNLELIASSSKGTAPPTGVPTNTPGVTGHGLSDSKAQEPEQAIDINGNKFVKVRNTSLRALCRGCGKMGDMEGMYHSEALGLYCHPQCVPQIKGIQPPEKE